MVVFERLLLAAGLLLLGYLSYRGWVALQLKRRRSEALGLPGYRAGAATILYFTTPGCMPCQTIQQPALAQIEQRFGRSLSVLQFDASRHPELADAWGVLSAPTTFIIDRQGRPRGVNHGVARADKLEAQLKAIGIEPLVQPEPQETKWAISQDG
jgi:thiol-disulfide isomerase/thioredoxin